MRNRVKVYSCLHVVFVGGTTFIALSLLALSLHTTVLRITINFLCMLNLSISKFVMITKVTIFVFRFFAVEWVTTERFITERVPAQCLFLIERAAAEWVFLAEWVAAQGVLVIERAAAEWVFLAEWVATQWVLVIERAAAEWVLVLEAGRVSRPGAGSHRWAPLHFHHTAVLLASLHRQRGDNI